MSLFRLFLFCLIISIGFIYGLRMKGRNKLLIPGDIYIEKQGTHIYIPVSSALLIAFLMFIIIRAFFGL